MPSSRTALAVLLCLGLAAPGPRAAAGGEPASIAPVTTAAQAVALNRTNLTGRVPLHLQVVCLYLDRAWGSTWLGDATGAFWTDTENCPRTLRPGDRIDLTATTRTGQPWIDWSGARMVHQGTNQYPAPRMLRGEELGLSQGGDIWTELEGIVRRVNHQQGHIHAEMIVENRLCEITLPTPERHEELVEEAEIRCRGVIVPADRFSPPDVQLKLFVPESRFLSVTHPDLRRHFAVPLLDPVPGAARPIGARVRLHGVVERQEPGRLVLRDTALGACVAESRLASRVRPGTRLELVGTLSRTRTGEFRLEQALYRPLPLTTRSTGDPIPSPASPATSTTPGRPDPTELHHLSEVRSLALADSQRGWPVSVDAVVLADLTELGWDVLFVQDDTGASYVHSGTNVWHLKAGDRIRLEGVTEASHYGTNIRDPRIRRLGPGEPPAPRHTSLGHLQLGSEDARWVEVHGWVRQAVIQENVLRLDLCDGSGRLSVHVGSNVMPLGIRDSLVAIRGAVAARLDDSGQLTGVGIFCPSLDEVRIETPAPDEPFGFPPSPVATLRLYNTQPSGLRRVKIEGVVTARAGGTTLFVQDGDHGVVVRLWEEAAVAPGTGIEAVGIPFFRSSQLELHDARVRATGKCPQPAARGVRNLDAAGPGHFGLRCSLEAELTSVSRLKDTLIFDFAAGTHFDARCPAPADPRALLALPPGSRLRLTGAVECLGESPDSTHDHRLHLASAEDAVVLVRGPWWGPRHTYAATGAAMVSLATGLVWVRSLRRQVRVRTTELTHELAERRQVEDALRGSLREKEALLREIHHRVKNNLQIVSSLLSLQSAQVDHPATREALTDTQGRVRSMALLHEALYRSGNLAMVDVRAYIGSLVAHLGRALPAAANRVRFVLEIADVSLDLDRAVPCGVIINELVTNSLKHAFPGERSGTILVRLQAISNHRLSLLVADDGVGLPTDLNLTHTGSLGLPLVSDLARQLGAHFDIGPGPGASFQLTFAQNLNRL